MTVAFSMFFERREKVKMLKNAICFTIKTDMNISHHGRVISASSLSYINTMSMKTHACQ